MEGAMKRAKQARRRSRFVPVITKLVIGERDVLVMRSENWLTVEQRENICVMCRRAGLPVAAILPSSLSLVVVQRDSIALAGEAG